MTIGGIQRLSLIDYPGIVSSVIFTAGCNFRCPYCHNPDLVFPSVGRAISEEDVIFSVKNSRKMIDGAVVTGGEPTVHSDLPEFLRKIKDLGLLVKLDTNGTNPDLLGRVLSLGLVDYVAMDLKAPLDKYGTICGVSFSVAENIASSMAVLRSSDVRYEFRTTIFPEVLSEEDYSNIVGLLHPGESYYLQGIRFGKTLGNLAAPKSYDPAEKLAGRLKIAFPEIGENIFVR